MRKKYLFGMAGITLAIALGFTVTKNRSITMSNLQFANVEALSNEENDCHHTNGYRVYSVSKPNFWTSKKSFRDCCGVEKTGYNPQEDCR